jgi:hypothetical protein
MIENPIRSIYSVRKMTPSESGRWGAEGTAEVEADEDTKAGTKEGSALNAKAQLCGRSTRPS